MQDRKQEKLVTEDHGVPRQRHVSDTFQISTEGEWSCSIQVGYPLPLRDINVEIL